VGVTERVKSHRERMRERGYRPVQLWLPDVRGEAFAAQASRQSRLVAASDRAGDDQDFVEAVTFPWDQE
jgi:hypothetical protein